MPSMKGNLREGAMMVGLVFWVLDIPFADDRYPHRPLANFFSILRSQVSLEDA